MICQEPVAAPSRTHACEDYYRQRYERNRGMRVDFLLGSPSLLGRVHGAFVDREERGGSDGHGNGASDHAPVIVDLG